MGNSIANGPWQRRRSERRCGAKSAALAGTVSAASFDQTPTLSAIMASRAHRPQRNLWLPTVIWADRCFAHKMNFNGTTQTMQALKYMIVNLALAAIVAVSEPASAATVTYSVSGTFESLSGSDYSALSGGSFTGTFVAPSHTFPLAPSTYDYLNNFQINLYTANGSLFSTLSSTGWTQSGNTGDTCVTASPCGGLTSGLSPHSGSFFCCAWPDRLQWFLGADVQRYGGASS
jgi:hypothetical protein